MQMQSKILMPFYLLTLALVCLWSAIDAPGRMVWWMEVIPAVLAIALLAATYKRFEFTPLVYFLVWVHCIILFVGGHYTYEAVPLFNYIRDFFGHGRNNYDKIGHLAQGFIPAIVARELLIRTSPLRPGNWMVTLILLSILGISAFYELIEWWAAAAMGGTADSFLGSQGDIWDAQKDMLCALLGAAAALLTLSGLHNRQLKKIKAL